MNLDDWWTQHPRSDWQQQAKCRKLPTEIFYRADTTVAQFICRTCQVSEDCLVDTLKTEPTKIGGRFGVFGGMTPQQRERFYRRLLRERRSIRARLGETA